MSHCDIYSADFFKSSFFLFFYIVINIVSWTFYCDIIVPYIFVIVTYLVFIDKSYNYNILNIWLIRNYR